MIELRHLRYFVAVAEELHFGRAALRLGVSQPPLSQQIRVLEKQLDVTLFARTSRQVVLTEAGRQFLVEARRTLDQATRAAEVARDAQRGTSGALHVTVTAMTPFAAPVSAGLTRFAHDCPDVSLVLRDVPRAEQIGGLLAGRVDVAFIRAPERPALPPQLTATLLIEEPLIAVLPATHVLADRETVDLRDLAAAPFALYSAEEDAGFNDQVRAVCGAAGFEPRVVHQVRELTALLGLVAAGLGVTIATETLCRLRIDGIVYRTIAPVALSRLWLVRLRDPRLIARRFAETVLAAG